MHLATKQHEFTDSKDLFKLNGLRMVLKRFPAFFEACRAIIDDDPLPFIKFLGLEDMSSDIMDIFERSKSGVAKTNMRDRLSHMALKGMAVSMLEDFDTPMTLKEALDIELPDFVLTDQKTGSNSTGEWPEVSTSNIEQMEDCTFETIESVLGHMFSEEIPETNADLHFRRAFIQSGMIPKFEDDVQFVARLFILPILQKCAEVGVLHLPEELGIKGEVKVTIGEREEISEGIECESKRIPDWAAYILLKGQQTFVLLGETKLSSKWKSADLPTYCDSSWIVPKETRWPLRQLAGQCVHAGTPWALAYTPLEVVLCRFYKVPSINDKLTFGVQYQAIPLGRKGKSGELSAMLGIWSWIMFSCIERHREFVGRSQLCPLKDIFTTAANTPLISKEVIMQNSPSYSVPISSDEIQQQISLTPNTIGGQSVQKRRTRARKSGSTRVKNQIGIQKPPTPGIWDGRLRSRKAAHVIGVKAA